MSSVITVMNMKGGVGKTVVAAHVAGMLPRYGFGGKWRKVLLLDFDPQFNLSQMFLTSKTYFRLEEEGKTSRAILQDDETNQDPFRLRVPGNHSPPSIDDIRFRLHSNAKGGLLDIVPSTLDLMYLALGQLPSRTSVFDERFGKFIGECRTQYDAVVIDCHPSGSMLTRMALSHSDHVLIPVVPTSPFAARGIGLMKQFLSDIGSQRPTAHILFNLRKSLLPNETAIRNDPKHQGDCFTNVMHLRKAFADPSEGQGFVWSSGRPYSRGARLNAYQIVAEVVSRLAL